VVKQKDGINLLILFYPTIIKLSMKKWQKIAQYYGMIAQNIEQCLLFIT